VKLSNLRLKFDEQHVFYISSTSFDELITTVLQVCLDYNTGRRCRSFESKRKSCKL